MLLHVLRLGEARGGFHVFIDCIVVPMWIRGWILRDNLVINNLIVIVFGLS